MNYEKDSGVKKLSAGAAEKGQKVGGVCGVGVGLFNIDTF